MLNLSANEAETASLIRDKEPKPEIRTRCTNCVFALVRNKLQYGCKLGRVEKLRSRDIWYYHEEDNYYNLPFYCNTARTYEWGSAQTDDWAKCVYKEIALKVACVIYLADTNLDNALVTIKSLLKQEYKPSDIVLVVRDQTIPPFNIIKALGSAVGNEVKWAFERIVDSSLTYWQALDKGIERAKHQKRFAIFQAGYKVPHRFLQTLDDSINRNLDRWVMVLPQDSKDNGLVCMTNVWESVGGFGTKGLQEKVSILEQEQNTNLVKKFEELNV